MRFNSAYQGRKVAHEVLEALCIHCHEVRDLATAPRLQSPRASSVSQDGDWPVQLALDMAAAVIGDNSIAGTDLTASALFLAVLACCTLHRLCALALMIITCTSTLTCKRHSGMPMSTRTHSFDNSAETLYLLTRYVRLTSPCPRLSTWPDLESLLVDDTDNRAFDPHASPEGTVEVLV